jgi:hypothetical protein
MRKRIDRMRVLTWGGRLPALRVALGNCLYNIDRAIASLFGAPPQETISSEIGRHENTIVGRLGAMFLDGIQRNHCENAVRHADALDRVDDGFRG